MNRSVFVAALVLLVGVVTGVVAPGQSGSGFSSLSHVNPTCSAPSVGNLTGFPVLEEQVASISCRPFPPTCTGGTIGSVTDLRWQRYVDAGVIASSARVQGTQILPCANAAGGIAAITHFLTATDIVFTDAANPAATGTLAGVTANFEFTGSVAFGNSCSPPIAGIIICAGTLCINDLGGELLGTLTPAGGTGHLVGYSNDDSVASLTSGPLFSQPTLGVPLTFGMGVRTNVRAVLCAPVLLPTQPTSTLGHSRARLSLPLVGPAFNVPLGITVNSVQLGIVNNQWVGAAPQPAVAPTGVGCPGSDGLPVTLSATGLPRAGNDAFSLQVSGTPGTSALLLFALGLAPTPLPVTGACSFLLDLTSTLAFIAAGASPLGPVPVTGGVAEYALPVPLSLALVGAVADFQGLVIDPALAGGVATTNALTLTVGI